MPMLNDIPFASSVLMIRPANFGYNPETASSNTFQRKDESADPLSIKIKAREEFDTLVEVLQSHGIEVLIVDDTDQPIKPDAVFPNNWITTHEDGALITYPMYAPLRRAERRDDIIAIVEKKYKVRNRYTFDHYEEENKILEGTGSMILDRTHRIVYACISPRTDAELLEHFALLRQYQKVSFRAKDPSGIPIYHTNVIMALGHDLAVLCLDCISDEAERDQVVQMLHDTNKEILEITWPQVLQFAGNMLQVSNDRGEHCWVMSDAAYRSLNLHQLKRLNASGTIITSPIPTIERYGGGSVRCMIAEIFLTKKKKQNP